MWIAPTFGMPCRLFFVIVFFCLPAFAESLTDLDAIVARAPSLDAFLANQPLVDEYFAALQGYYGADKFPRGMFDLVLKQLREVKEKVPSLKERLWETTGIGAPFAVTADWSSYGRTLDVDKWNAHHTQMLARWRAEAGQLAGKDPKDALREVQGLLARLAAETRGLDAQLAGKKRAEADAAREAFFRAKREDAGLKAAASYLLLSKIDSEEFRDKLHSGDPDLILETLNEARGSLRGIFERDGIVLGAAATLLQERVPTLSSLLADKEMFPIAMRRTNRGTEVAVGRAGRSTFEFKPVPRRLHGIFKGIVLRECVGGGREGSLTPERWATVALTGAQLYHVEKRVLLENGETATEYLGFTQSVPLRNKQGEIVGSTDFGAPALRNPKLFAAWLKQMSGRLPEGWRGLAVSDQYHINNAGVLGMVHANKGYELGASLGSDAEWKHLDGFASDIHRVSPADPWGYAGDMIFDGRGYKDTLPFGNMGGLTIYMRKHGKLRLLDPEWERNVTDPQRLAEVFAAPDVERGARVAAYLATVAQGDPEVRARLERMPVYPRLLSWNLGAEKLAALGQRLKLDPRSRRFGFYAGLVAVASEVTAFYLMEGLSGNLRAIPGIGGAFAGLASGMGLVDIFHWPANFLTHYGMLRDEAAVAGKRANPLRAVGQLCRAALRTVVGSRTP